VHLLADAAVSAGVVIAGVLVLFTGWAWLDPATSLLISAVILLSTIPLFRDALNLLLDAVPEHIDPEEVEAYLASLPNVESVHDLHIWSMSSTEAALTAHVVMAWEACPPQFLRDLEVAIEHRFGIAHTTIQIEPLVSDTCRLAAGHS
jgi:cobalt-zinc-cadmium efflux system protein